MSKKKKPAGRPADQTPPVIDRNQWIALALAAAAAKKKEQTPPET